MPLMVAAADDLLARIDAADRRKPVDIDPMMTHVAADIIFRTLFSEALDERRSNIIHNAFGKFQRFAHSASMLRLYGAPARWFEARSLKPAKAIHDVFRPIVKDITRAAKRPIATSSSRSSRRSIPTAANPSPCNR
jgi:hypothetical protein